jgi:hypothetical protein
MRVSGARALAVLLAGLAIPVVAEGGEIALSFGDAPGGAARGFRIERRAAGDLDFAPVALVGPGVSDFVDRDLPDGSRYCYRVRSLLETAATWSPEVCAVAETASAEPEPAPAPVGEAPAPALATEDAAAEPATEPAPPGEAPPRRIRTSGGWLQVLD